MFFRTIFIAILMFTLAGPRALAAPPPAPASRAPAAKPAGPFDAASLDQSIALGRQFLLSAQRPDGSMIYEWHAEKGADLGTRNAVREMGALWVLAVAHRQRATPQTTLAITKALKLQDKFAKRSAAGGRYFAEPGAPEWTTNAVALHVLTLLDFLAAPGALDAALRTKYEKDLADEVKFLMSLRLPGGRFASTYRTVDGKGVGSPSPWADGEALLALTRAAKLKTADPAWRDAALESAAVMYGEYVRLALRSDPDSKEAIGFYQWGTMAFYELYTSGWPGTKAYAPRAVAMARWMTDVQPLLKAEINTGFAFEGVITAWELARLSNDVTNKQHLAKVIQQGMPKLLSWQIGSRTATDFTVPGSFLKFPKSKGGILHKPADPRLRIDVMQHQLHATMLARRFMFPSPASGRRRCWWSDDEADQTRRATSHRSRTAGVTQKRIIDREPNQSAPALSKPSTRLRPPLSRSAPDTSPGAQRMKPALALALGVLALIPVTLHAEILKEAKPKDVSPLLAPIIQKRDVPGMAAAVVQDGETVALGVTGVRTRGKPDKIAAADKFHIGSDTKAMTAMLCGVLVDEGKLKWTQTLGETFPELKKSMNAQYQAVTLEQLLTHRGGAPGDITTDDLWAKLWQHKGTPTSARRLLLQGVTSKAPETAPGTKYIYSNAGVSIAGHMAEKVAGKPWEDLMREKIFKPLGMTSAGFGAPGTPKKNDQPRGHKQGGTPVEPGPGADNPVGIGPAGIVHCSIGDWAKFAAANLPSAKTKVKLVKPETLKKLHTPAPGGGMKYAMGWIIADGQPWAGGPALTHGGSNTMWMAVAWLAPGKDFAVLIACNQANDAACNDAALALIADHFKGE